MSSNANVTMALCDRNVNQLTTVGDSNLPSGSAAAVSVGYQSSSRSWWDRLGLPRRFQNIVTETESILSRPVESASCGAGAVNIFTCKDAPPSIPRTRSEGVLCSSVDDANVSLSHLDLADCSLTMASKISKSLDCAESLLPITTIAAIGGDKTAARGGGGDAAYRVRSRFGDLTSVGLNTITSLKHVETRHKMAAASSAHETIYRQDIAPYIRGGVKPSSDTHAPLGHGLGASPLRNVTPSLRAALSSLNTCAVSDYTRCSPRLCEVVELSKSLACSGGVHAPSPTVTRCLPDVIANLSMSRRCRTSSENGSFQSISNTDSDWTEHENNSLRLNVPDDLDSVKFSRPDFQLDISRIEAQDECKYTFGGNSELSVNRNGNFSPEHLELVGKVGRQFKLDLGTIPGLGCVKSRKVVAGLVHAQAVDGGASSSPSSPGFCLVRGSSAGSGHGSPIRPNVLDIVPLYTSTAFTTSTMSCDPVTGGGPIVHARVEGGSK